MIQHLASLLDVPPDNVVPFSEWLKRVRRSPLSDQDNPAVKLADFLGNDFERMSCGGLILDTKLCCEASEALRNRSEIRKEDVELFVQSWRNSGFLQ